MTDNGWIKHDGGPMPVDGRARVVCLRRDGTVMRPALAKGRHWKHITSPHFNWCDITHYRIVEATNPHQEDRA